MSAPTVILYCPNCRTPLDKNAIGWICWRTFRPRSNDPAAASSPGSVGANIYGAASGSATGYRPVTDVLCKHYNGPGEDECLNSDCKGDKVKATALPACAECRFELPPLENLCPSSMTLVGPSGSGKTHYIVALHDWWQRKLGGFGLTPMPSMGRVIENHFKTFRKAVRDGKVVPGSPKGQMITFTWRIMPPVHTGMPSLLFSMPDVSGEDLMDAEQLAINRVLHFTSGIIFMLDGDRIGTAMNIINDPDGRDPSDHLECAQAMMNDLLRRLPPAELTKMPVAVCVNKVDRLIENSEEWANIMASEPDHHQGFDANFSSQRSIDIENLLMHHGDATTAFLRSNFENIMFFGIASIGSNTTPIQWRPISVEDPFLWLLYHHRYIGPATAREQGY